MSVILGRIREIERYYLDLMFKQVNTDKDHVHVLVSIPPSWSIGQATLWDRPVATLRHQLYEALGIYLSETHETSLFQGQCESQ